MSTPKRLFAVSNYLGADLGPRFLATMELRHRGNPVVGTSLTIFVCVCVEAQERAGVGLVWNAGVPRGPATFLEQLRGPLTKGRTKRSGRKTTNC